MTTFQTPYTILEVPRTATPQMIRNGYRLACMRHHPDRPHNQTPDYDPEVFLVIQAAYDLLQDPIQRRAYDDNPYPFPNDPQDQALMTGKDASLEREARELIASIFTRYIEKMDFRSARNFDIQKNMRRELGEGVTQMKRHKKACRATAMKLNVIRHRLSPTPYLHEVLRSKRLANLQTWISARWQILIARRSLDILFEVEYQVDPEPVSPFGTSTSQYDIRPSVNYRPTITFT